MSRKDNFGIEVEVGDIVLSSPRSKYSGKPSVGRVTGVFDSGRVTIQLPLEVSIYAYERGAPKVERTYNRYGPLTDDDGNGIMEEYRDHYGRTQKRAKYGSIPYTEMVNDYTVVGKEWKWIKTQASDLNLVILRKKDEEGKTKDITEILAERAGFNELARNLALDYDTPSPVIPE